MKPQVFQLACFFLADKQKGIASGKVQRWEVLKWAVTVNVALATASLAIQARPAIFIMCAAVAGASIGLIFYYNYRMTKTRQSAIHLMDRLSKEVTDLNDLTGEPPYPADLANYDCVELTIFSFVIGFSVLPSVLIWVLEAPFFKHH